MKPLASLYRLADRRNIPVCRYPMPQTGSVSVQLEDGRCYIGLDERPMLQAEERTRLAHELGHCVTGSFYNRHTAVDSRARHEVRADKWAIRRLISKEDLDAAVAAGHTELYDLADYFGVSEEFVRKAVCLHTYGNVAADLYF